MERHTDAPPRTTPMSTDPASSKLTIVPGSWGHKKFKLKNRFKQLSDADLQYEPGQEAELVQRLCQRLHMSTAEVEMIITGT